jgi:5'(3')-deoxyribonucleotidase
MITIYIDMDSVLADFEAAIDVPKGVWIKDPPQMLEPGFFKNLPVVSGAKEAITELLTYPDIDLYIASKPSTDNLLSATEKYQWIQEHFPELLNKIFLTCDKSKLKGDYLIDDDIKWLTFDGKFIHFNPRKPKAEWDRILKFFSMDKQLYFLNENDFKSETN